ncbi:MAG TPA: glycosyltransferase family 1 protein [Thermoanaerobaculia bacterium]|nr:glycosyltransferase family 1 protein [Thermoanaerobaculia bacterium]
MENRTRINPHGSRLPSSLPPSVSPQSASPRAQAVARRSGEAVSQPDIVCLSHLRWDFVFQRPQHLLTRFARESRVFYVEEPEFHRAAPSLSVTLRENGVHVVVPRLPEGLAPEEQAQLQKELLDDLLRRYAVRRFVLWYYTPMALAFSRHLRPLAIVYDCMDELSAFAGAPRALREREAELMVRADLVLTGGQSLYEAKKNLHPNVHPFPSSVDVAHFAQARNGHDEPADQAPVPRPRLGYFGVIDERMDLELVRGVALARPDWQLVFLGPTAKIDPATFPKLPNVHALGRKSYEELPAYVAGWDVAMLPFARNESTRFISPTKTPEYLAAGRPVVSTSIRDVVRPYGQQGLARIADDVDDFVAAAEAALSEDPEPRLRRADAFLSKISWERTFSAIRRLMADTLDTREEVDQSGALAG